MYGGMMMPGVGTAAQYAATTGAPRVPKDLQSVFLASNRGEEVKEVPKSAFGIFSRGLRIRWLPRRLVNLRGGGRNKPNRGEGEAGDSKQPQRNDHAAAANTKPSSPRNDATTSTSDSFSTNRTTPTKSFRNLFSRGSNRSVNSNKSDRNSPRNSSRQGRSSSRHGLSPEDAFSTTDVSESEHQPPPVLVLESCFETSPLKEDERRMTAKDAEQLKIDEEAAVIAKPSVSPQDYLDALLYARGYSTRKYPALQSAYFNRPTPLQQASFQSYVLNCVKIGNSAELIRLLKDGGLAPNPANRFGESLIHKTCRLGRSRMLSEMVHKVPGLDVRYCDEHGRTPLFDACAANSVECWEVLCDVDLRMLHMADHLNMVPLQFVPQTAWGDWIVLLDAKKDSYWPEHKFDLRTHEEPPPLFTLQPPNSRPVKDPVNAVPLDLAEQVAQGKITPDFAQNEAKQRLVASLAAISNNINNIKKSSSSKLAMPPLIANLEEMYDLDDIDFDETSSSSSDDSDDDDSESDITDEDATNTSETHEEEEDAHDAAEEDIDDVPSSDDDASDDYDEGHVNAPQQRLRSSNYAINLGGQQEAMNVLLGIRRPEATPSTL